MKKATRISLSEIKPNPNNPRVIKGPSFKKLVESIKTFPEMMAARPIVVDKNMVVLGGNMRLKALQELGRKEAFVYVADWDDVKNREFIIKDNVGFGEWDWDMLANEWENEELIDWGLDVVGFPKDEATEDDYEVPDTIETDIILGDLFQIGEHRLLCGDATIVTQYKKLFGDERADVVLTDPPYNVAYEGKTKDALTIKNDKQGDDVFYKFLCGFYTSAAEYAKAGGAWYVWHADSEGANFRKAMVDSGVSLRQCLMWVKNSMVMGRQDYHWQHEPCLYGWKEGAAHSWYSDRKQTTILNFDRPSRSTEHPTMKPIPLLAYLLGNSSKSGDLVSDPFLGSGSTMVASHQLERKCYGMELDPKYCQVIIDRMVALDKDLEVTKNGVRL